MSAGEYRRRTCQRVLVLVVEDEPDEARLIELAIRQAGVDCEIDFVEDGERALAHLRACAEAGSGASLPDYVLLDVNLPDLSGYDVLDEIRSDPSLRSLYVAINTSATARDAHDRARRHGADRVLVKPVTAADITLLETHLGAQG